MSSEFLDLRVASLLGREAGPSCAVIAGVEVWEGGRSRGAINKSELRSLRREVCALRSVQPNA